MSASPLPWPRAKFFMPGTNLPIAGGKVWTYLSGTTTPQQTLVSPSGSANTNPVVLDANGEAPIYLIDGISYTINVLDASNNQIPGYPVDNIIVADTALRANLANTASTSLGDALVGVLKTGGLATTQHNVNENRPFNLKTDWPSTVGDGVTDDGPELVLGIAAGKELELSNGTYLTSTVAVTQPLNQTLFFQHGAKVTISGTGTFTPAGNQVKFGWNPENRTNWIHPGGVGDNYEGVSGDIGNFGRRNHIGVGHMVGVSGSVAVPNSSTIPAHCSGVAGYARSDSTTTGAVGVYGRAWPDRAGVSPFAGNFLITDEGFQVAAYGVEIDANITNVSSVVRGLYIVGASTVEPTLSPAINIDPLGVGTSPVKRWSHAFKSEDGAAQIGILIGALFPSASQGAQTFQMNYRSAGNASTIGMQILVDSGGNTSISSRTNGSILDLQSSSGGTGQGNIRLVGAQVGFFTSTGATKQTVTGAKGGNAALTSLIAAMVAYGFITDTTT